MPPSNHALLGASSSKRWISCPPSARLGEGLPDTPSDYAAAGTLAHAIAELKVRKYIEPMSTRSYNSQMKKLKADEHYGRHVKEMPRCCVFSVPPTPGTTFRIRRATAGSGR